DGKPPFAPPRVMHVRRAASCGIVRAATSVHSATRSPAIRARHRAAFAGATRSGNGTAIADRQTVATARARLRRERTPTLPRPRIPLGAVLALAAIPLLAAGGAFSLRELGRARDQERMDRGAALASLLAQSLEGTGEELGSDHGILLRLTEYAGRS